MGVGGVKLTWRGSDGGGCAGGRMGSAVVKLEFEGWVCEGVGRGAPVRAWAGWGVDGDEVDGALLGVEGEGEVEENGQGAMAVLLIGSCGIMARLSCGVGGETRITL